MQRPQRADAAAIAVLPPVQTNPQAGAAGKPTSVAPSVSADDVVTLNWNLTTSSVTSLASQKSIRATGQKSGLRSTALPTQATPSVESKVTTTRPGESKATVGPVPIPQPGSVATVNWTASTASHAASRRPVIGKPFQAAECPELAPAATVATQADVQFVGHVDATAITVVNQPEDLPVLSNAAFEDLPPVGAVSGLPELQKTPTTPAEQQFASLTETQSPPNAESHTVHPQDLAELQQLRSQSAAFGAETVSEGSYLSDLHELLEQPSQFLFVDGSMLDLAPGEPQLQTPAYLKDLESLLSGASSTVGRNTAFRGQTLASGYRYGTRSEDSNGSPLPEMERYIIPPAPGCPASGSSPLSAIFEPVTAIRLTGMSTKPPTRKPAITSPVLAHPENKACAYLEADSPAFYLTATQFRVNRPNRQPQAFHHNPLYFEDANLERCGQSSGCLTTVHSAVHFATMIALTPYLTTATPPCSCVQALPDCPTCGEFGCEAYFPAWSWKGAVVQAAAVTGIVFIVP